MLMHMHAYTWVHAYVCICMRVCMQRKCLEASGPSCCQEPSLRQGARPRRADCSLLLSSLNYQKLHQKI